MRIQPRSLPKVMMPRPLPSLSALKSFEAVAKQLSFSKAAVDLGVTQAAVSRQVKRLEEEIGVELIRRHGGGNTLTDAGELLFGALHRAFGDVGNAIAEIVGNNGREILNVSVSPFLSARWLTPRLMKFMNSNPHIDVRLHHSYHPADHRRERIDLGINWGGGNWPLVESIKLIDGSLVAVASPEFMKTTGASIKHPQDLIAHQLFYEFDLSDWQGWFTSAGSPSNAISASRLSDSHVLRRAIIDGYGIGLFFAALIEDDVKTDRMIPIFSHSVHVGNDYYINYSSRSELSAKAKHFKRFLMGEVGSIRRPSIEKV